MTSPIVGEFLGTMIIVLLGNGVVAGVLLKRSKAEGSGWMVITAGWAFAVMAGVFVSIACGSNDAHLNPVVTVGFAVRDASFGKLAAVSCGAVPWRDRGSYSCLASLFAALERDARMLPQSWRVFAPRLRSAAWLRIYSAKSAQRLFLCS